MKLILKDNQKYVLRLDKGENLFDELVKFAESDGIQAGSFSAFGACDQVALGFYHGAKKEYEYKTIEEETEIVSCQGLVGKLDGKTMVHAHGSFSSPDMTLRGGHIKELIVGSTCEVFLTKLEGSIDREFDDEIGLNLMR